MKKFITSTLILFLAISVSQIPSTSFAEDEDEVQKIQQQIAELNRSEKIIQKRLTDTDQLIADQRKLNRYYGAWHYGSVGVAVIASAFLGSAGTNAILTVAVAEASTGGCLLSVITFSVSMKASLEIFDYSNYDGNEAEDEFAFIKKKVRYYNETFENAHHRIEEELETVLAKLPNWGAFGWNEKAYVVAQIEALESHKVLYQAQIDTFTIVREHLLKKLLSFQLKEETTTEQDR